MENNIFWVFRECSFDGEEDYQYFFSSNKPTGRKVDKQGWLEKKHFTNYGGWEFDSGDADHKATLVHPWLAEGILGFKLTYLDEPIRVKINTIWVQQE